MLLQFGFNPRKKKSRKKAKKKAVAKTKRSSHAKAMRHTKKKKKNPQVYSASKKINGKTRKIGGGHFFVKKELEPQKAKVAKAAAAYQAAPASSAAKSKARAAFAKESAKLRKMAEHTSGSLKDLQTYQKDGAKIRSKYIPLSKWEKMSDKQKAKEESVAKAKKSKKAKKKAAKKSTKKKSIKKSVKKSASKKKSTKRRSKAQKAATKKLIALNKAKKASKSKSKPKKSRKSRRRAKLYTHRHGLSMRHLKKGTRIKFKGSKGKGKKKVSISGSFKINPYKRNPFMKLDAQTKKYMNMEVKEIGALAVGGMLVPVVNGALAKVPGVNTFAAMINQYLGPQAAGSVIPVLAGVALNAAAEHLVTGKNGEYLKLAGEGLAAAGIIGLSMGVSQQYIAPSLGMSGINFTPRSLAGINYTPRSMSGINYTPKSLGAPTVSQSSADFGRFMNTARGADFGRGPDFGKSLDYDVDEMTSDDDIDDDGMGSMG